MSEQPPSNYLTSIIKEVLVKKGATEQYSWKYLFTKTNVGISFLDTIIKSNPYNCWAFYRRIVEYALKIGNAKICYAILNSKELISFLISNQTSTEVQSEYNIIKELVNTKYEKYKNSYLFEAMKTN